MVIMANAITPSGAVLESTSRKYNRADESLAIEQVEEWEEVLTEMNEEYCVDQRDSFPVMIDWHQARTQLSLWKIKAGLE